MTLSHSKGPAEGKEKTGDKSIMKFWLVWRTEDSIVGGLLHKKSSLNLLTSFSGKVSSIKCSFKEIRGD